MVFLFYSPPTNGDLKPAVAKSQIQSMYLFFFSFFTAKSMFLKALVLKVLV